MIKPIGARTLIETFKGSEQTESGLLLDNSSNTTSAPVRGTVLIAGDESVFKEGDVLFFRRYSLDELKIITEKGEQVVSLVEDADVIAMDLLK